MNKARIVQIGINGFGRFVLEAVTKVKNIELTGVYDINGEALAEVSEEFGLKAFGSLEEALHSECDGVILELPNSLHLNVAKQAAMAGKHISIDKPITTTVEDAEEMIRVCREQGVLLQVGHCTRYLKKYRRLKEIVDSGAIGRIILVEATYSSDTGKLLKGTEWRCFKEHCPGGPMLQLGIHTIDNIFYLTGLKPIEVKGLFTDDHTGTENDDAGMIVMKLENGVLAYVGSSYVSPYTDELTIYGDRGRIRTGGNTIHVDVKGSSSTRLNVRESNEYANYIRQYESFARCILQGVKPEVGGEEGLRNLKVITDALR